MDKLILYQSHNKQIPKKSKVCVGAAQLEIELAQESK
jgi:hypothetical protein